MSIKINASLVLYKNKAADFEACIDSFLSSNCAGSIYIVDNSPSPLSSEKFSHARVVYINACKNLGFGAGHNLALNSSRFDSDYHVFLNPDILFDNDVLNQLADFFEKSPNVSCVMPQIKYPNGDLQVLCKLLPTPLDLIVRRFIPFEFVRDFFDKRYELRQLQQTCPMNVPSISGCFLMARTANLSHLGGFDDRYFMYMEDIDLVRRLSTLGDVFYYPLVSVTHRFEKGSYKSKQLLFWHIRSALIYFSKWGWIFDAQRSSQNRRVLNKLKNTRQIL